VFACSGPGAMAKIARNTEIGHQHAAIVGGLVVASLAVYLTTRRRWGVPVAVLALFAVHPSWTVGTLSGDCGYFVRDTSPFLTWAAGLIVAAQAAYTGWVLVRAAGREAEGDYDQTPDGAKRDGRLGGRDI
jgi:ABC-type Fe3+-siderophore transport system permease subunit